MDLLASNFSSARWVRRGWRMMDCPRHISVRGLRRGGCRSREGGLYVDATLGAAATAARSWRHGNSGHRDRPRPLREIRRLRYRRSQGGRLDLVEEPLHLDRGLRDQGLSRRGRVTESESPRCNSMRRARLLVPVAEQLDMRMGRDGPTAEM